VGAGTVSAPLWVSYALWAVMLIAGLRGNDRPNVDAVVRDRRLHAGLALVAVAGALSWGLWWGVAAGVVAAVTLRTASTARVGTATRTGHMKEKGNG